MQQPGRGHGTARTTAHNLFFALWPGDDVRAQIDARARMLGAGRSGRGRLVKPGRYHLTLHFLGEFAELPRRLLEDAVNAAAHVDAPAFDLTLDQAGSFDQVWWLGCTQPPEALLALWHALGTALTHAQAMVQSKSALTPHVTVLRGPVAHLPPTPVAPVAWPVRGFVLIDSEVASPSPYRIIDRWPLRGA